ncbi:MAG: ABC transporter substrate-binding protein [Candidatus Riflebacteria bacterium HGW-Riflebacteria-1]|nr:MAG: ABC transporter substrate-binding protein [Candidatus Riflebacteria bacterium HGW-Riflebacteria-1]
MKSSCSATLKQITEYSMRTQSRFALMLLILLAVAAVGPLLYAEEQSRIKVFTSILPQKYFVEKIASGLVDVEVLVGSGMSPHTFEPLPQQMSRLSRASIFFLVGVPFEQSLTQRLSAICPDLKLVNTDKGVTRRLMSSNDGGHEHGEDCVHEPGAPDPHIWLDPVLVIIQAENIAAALSEALPDHKERLAAGLQNFTDELRALDEELTAKLAPVKGETILVFHPAFGYFADRYGLEQQAVEIEGKEPGPRQLADLIRQCRRQNIHTVFVQKQFPVAAAQTIARAINGTVMPIDPLAEDYVDNLRQFGEALLAGAK